MLGAAGPLHCTTPTPTSMYGTRRKTSNVYVAPTSAVRACRSLAACTKKPPGDSPGTRRRPRAGTVSQDPALEERRDLLEHEARQLGARFAAELSEERAPVRVQRLVEERVLRTMPLVRG